MHLLALYLTAILIQRYQIRLYSILVYYPVHIYILLYYSESVSRVHYYNGFSLQFITNWICSTSIRLLYDDAAFEGHNMSTDTIFVRNKDTISQTPQKWQVSQMWSYRNQIQIRHRTKSVHTSHSLLWKFKINILFPISHACWPSDYCVLTISPYYN